MIKVALLVSSLVLLPGCPVDSTQVTELSMDVSVTKDSSSIYVREVDRQCTCSAGEWPQPGTCASWSDGITCDCTPNPGDCVDSLRLVRDGELIKETPFDAWAGGTGGIYSTPLHDGDVLEVVGCGGIAEIPLDLAGLPKVTISGEIESGELVMTWTTEPAGATAPITTGDGFVAEPCHAITSSGRATSRVPDYTSRVFGSVHAFAPLQTYDTDLGVAKVWRGERGRASVDIQ